MLLVVVIIGVLVSVAVPRFSVSFDSMKAKSGAYDVAATLDYARATSILEGRTLRFEAAASGTEVRVTEERAPADRKAFLPLVRPLPDGVRVVAIDFADALVAGRGYVDFRPDGGCEPCTLKVLGVSGEEYDVQVLRGAMHATVARRRPDE